MLKLQNKENGNNNTESVCLQRYYVNRKLNFLNLISPENTPALISWLCAKIGDKLWNAVEINGYDWFYIKNLYWNIYAYLELIFRNPYAHIDIKYDTKLKF